MTGLVRETRAMIAGMSPALDPANCCFVTVSNQQQAFSLMPLALGTFREKEGLSLIVPQEAAAEAGIEAEPFLCITLQVLSALNGVGLTSAVASALSAQNISCNIVAAFHHDHVFVPAGQSAKAMSILEELSQSARGGD